MSGVMEELNRNIEFLNNNVTFLANMIVTLNTTIQEHLKTMEAIQPEPVVEVPIDFRRKSELIRKMLDVEHAFTDDMTRDEREALDIERQMFVLRMGWNNLTVEELEDQVRKMGLEP